MKSFDGEENIIAIDEGKIAGHLHMELLKLGYVPSSDEILDITEIVFEYFCELVGAEIDGES